MSIVRIPFSLSVIWAVHVTMTAPQPPARDDERAGPVGWEVSIMPLCLKFVCWTAGIAEIMVVIAHTYPLNFWTSWVNTLLVNSCSEPSCIRITWSYILSWFLTVSGGVIRQRCYESMGDMFTFELSLRKRHRLVTSGPYSWVRHPSYTGAMLALFGALACHTTSGSWAVECSGIFPSSSARQIVIFFWMISGFIGFPLLMRRLEKEDKMLHEYFGPQWEAWASRVPCRLIPGVY